MIWACDVGLKHGALAKPSGLGIATTEHPFLHLPSVNVVSRLQTKLDDPLVGLHPLTG